MRPRRLTEMAAELRGDRRHIYAAARVLYGWATRERNYQLEPIELTQEDFDLALDAAAKYPAATLHEPAMRK